MLFAAQAMAAGTLMVPWVTRFVDPVMATGWHMILGGVPLAAASLATEADALATNVPQLTAGALLAPFRRSISNHLPPMSISNHLPMNHLPMSFCALTTTALATNSPHLI